MISLKADTIQVTVTQPTVQGSVADPMVLSGQPASGKQTQPLLAPLPGQQPVVTSSMQFQMWLATWQPVTQQYQMSLPQPPPQYPWMTAGTPRGLVPQTSYPWLLSQQPVAPPQGATPFAQSPHQPTVAQLVIISAPPATPVAVTATAPNPVSRNPQVMIAQ